MPFTKSPLIDTIIIEISSDEPLSDQQLDTISNTLNNDDSLHSAINLAVVKWLEKQGGDMTKLNVDVY